MIAPSSSPSPAIERSDPARSGRCAEGFLESGTSGTAKHEPDRGDRDVDQEHRAPPEVRQEQSADDRAERDPGPARRPPEADRALPLAASR